MVRSRTPRRAAAVGLVAVCLFAGPPAIAADSADALKCDGQLVTIIGTDR